ncbi:hypothetical protein HPB52_009981 [Rhipicephalus sanguineus]|uniref:CCHC-type domain-containing protein n=1 Tax=Rhipicephalus sanguineus TaxID=34632 RepID=A0A9D4QCL5_RHISA|nr:hypothetical protein HPB52_009981 [Rhipicephalus sanguineus]
MQYAGRISGYFDHWIEMSQTDKSFDSVRDVMIGEQFLEGCSMPLRVFLQERNCKTLDALAKNADCFIEAQHLANMSKEKTLKEATVEHSGKAEIPKTSRPTDRCFLCDKAGHRASECWSRNKRTPADRGWSRISGPGGGPSRQETGQASCMMAPSPPENPTDEGDGYRMGFRGIVPYMALSRWNAASFGADNARNAITCFVWTTKKDQVSRIEMVDWG